MAKKRKASERKRPSRTRGGTKVRHPRESLGDQLFREADEQHSDVVREWRKFMKALGIKGKPIGAKKLRERLLQRGMDPNKNEVSRAIIAAREE